MAGVGAIAGGLVAPFGVQAIGTALGTTTPKSVAPGLVTATGLGVGYMGRKNPLVLGAGLGLASGAGIMLANETFVNVPGISGPGAFTSNASASSSVVRQSVGRATFPVHGPNGMIGQGPKNYVNQTVGATSKPMRRLGMLASN